jgi:hypothetical protein
MVVRPQSIHRLPQFLSALFRAADLFAPDDPSLAKTLSLALKAECVQCKLHIEGDDLKTLAAQPVPNNDHPKLIRLRQGYCARNGCDSYYYNVVLDDHPNFDWLKLIELTETTLDQPTQPDSIHAATPPRTLKDVITHHPWMIRLALAITTLCLLFVLRQFYTGGTIPFIREPERFQVDVLDIDWPTTR